MCVVDADAAGGVGELPVVQEAAGLASLVIETQQPAHAVGVDVHGSFCVERRGRLTAATCAQPLRNTAVGKQPQHNKNCMVNLVLERAVLPIREIHVQKMLAAEPVLSLLKPSHLV